MKKNKFILRIITILFFLVYILLTFKFYNGLILNLQGYSMLQFIPIMFWSFIILTCIDLLIADVGFIKIGAILGIVAGSLILIFQMVNNTSDFDKITSDKYELIVEIEDLSDRVRVIVYKKDSIFFSKFVDSVIVRDYYNFSYEIVGDSLIITKCSVNSCITDEIDLE